jgi:nucleoside-diphosphate-sugar epimerase
MKAFVAGATGVLGRRAVARLVAAGIEVTGAARSDRNEDLLLRLGAAPLRVGLFDRDALVGAVSGHHVVLNLATAVLTGERAARRSGWEDHHRIRRQASHNLVDAALEVGASRWGGGRRPARPGRHLQRGRRSAAAPVRVRRRPHHRIRDGAARAAG